MKPQEDLYLELSDTWGSGFLCLFFCESLYNYPSLVPAQVRRQTWQKLKQSQARLHDLWGPVQMKMWDPCSKMKNFKKKKNEEFQDGHSRELKYRVLLSATIWVVHP